MTSLETLLKEGTKVLEQHKIQEARLDAWLLLEYVTGMNRAFYFAHSADGIEEEKADRYRELIRKRAGHIPLQHITHQAYFMGFEFYVNQNALVPRQDTETLVEKALEVMKGKKTPEILDMCTGSGCILLSLLALTGDAYGVGADVSPLALQVANKNAVSLEVCVNTTDSAVRLTHIPTGIVISCQDEKSQLKNKDKALKVLRSRLYEMELAKQHDAEAEARRSQIGTGDRSEKIRTYNFPQGRVTDHRIKLTLHRLDNILNGDLDEIIDSLIAADQAAKLSNLQEQ